ncbi:MAG: T9SS type A sorting domain-containing protein [Muribaculaceae bacterium]|nr:T9SS type A sorting domain-containing protein [Muribaculaceae bacterium]
MKKLLLYTLTALFALPALADINGNGYYRVQNAYTKRYAYLTDNKGSYDVYTSTADVGALQLFADPERVLSDPASVFFLELAPQGNSYYDIHGQGTSIHGFMNEYLSIMSFRQPYDGQTAYSVYASKSGMVKYLSDIEKNQKDEEGLASVDGSGDACKWYFHPIDGNTEQYFGVAPSVEAQGKFYAPMFAGFPFSAQSEGVKFYTINEIDHRGAAIINEVEGTIPASTPVIIECSTSQAASNRLNIGGSAEAVGNNLLKGVYFDNPLPNRHYNRTPFNKETMRVLGVGSDGRAAFVRGDYDFIPRNQAYLQLTDPVQYDVDEFILMTDEQRIEELDAVAVIPVTETVSVYSIEGRLVNAGISKADVPSLGKGMYILKSGQTSEKMIVH